MRKGGCSQSATRRAFGTGVSGCLSHRALPLSLISVGVTQALLAKGIVTTSPRFGSLPRLAFAGFLGYLLGKFSYTRECQEKLKGLENSPLGEMLRQQSGTPLQIPKRPQSEMSDPDTKSFDTMFQPAEVHSQASVKRDFEYGYNPEPPLSVGKEDYYSAPVEEDEPRKKSILYEDLRLKNRENYEVTLNQKADAMLKNQEPMHKTLPEREPWRPKNEVKKNIYGDTWED
ncbi:OCIA domain-containing protein 1-like isoform X2 [Centropristis striata]|uniref:OCIA domain-containing protein 1-like isoform X2 n=1 Tax=Centropristis striata TaxID=184440 RepID=UPI0027E004E4|nr:OCIA domain-containing protein 1-like isoform X2 [Centropristis striata]